MATTMQRFRGLAALLLIMASPGCSRTTRSTTEAARADQSAATTFPGTEWSHVDPKAHGWSAAGLAEADKFVATLDTGSLMVVHKGRVVLEYGDTSDRNMVQSMRKGLLDGLIGIAVDRGKINLNATLAELGIDDNPPLTQAEKNVRVEDLLRSRSGIYHSALYEHPSWKKRKPARGAHAPGSTFFYNNWDFNAIGTIFEKNTGTSIGPAFEAWIAKPVGMQDFRTKDVDYLTRRNLTEKMMKNGSDHRAYVFSMSTRDLARYGLLFLSRGQWNGRQLISSKWIDDSLRPVPNGLEGFDGFGYMWWSANDPKFLESLGLHHPVYAAKGAGGHLLLLVPEHDLVIAHNVPAGGVGLLTQLKRRYIGKAEVEDEDLWRLIAMIVKACPK